MEPLGEDYLQRFAEAVVQEVWNEMGRKRISSLRELARLSGMTHTSVIVRLNGDSRTGKRVPINVRDLAAFGNALGVHPSEFVSRAKAALDGPMVTIETLEPTVRLTVIEGEVFTPGRGPGSRDR